MNDELIKQTPNFISMKDQGKKLNASIKIENLRH